MSTHPIYRRAEVRIRSLDKALKELITILKDDRPEGIANVNVFILNNTMKELQKASFHVKDALTQIGYWEHKRGGRPRGFSPKRNYEEKKDRS